MHNTAGKHVSMTLMGLLYCVLQFDLLGITDSNFLRVVLKHVAPITHVQQTSFVVTIMPFLSQMNALVLLWMTISYFLLHTLETCLATSPTAGTV